jgi:hypothetical protein
MSDLKIVKEITMNKPNMVVELLMVADECIEASKACAGRINNRSMG